MNNWFLLTTDGANTWAVLEGAQASPGVGTLRIEGQTPSVTTSMGVIDGGGDITSRVEVQQQLFFDILGSLTETQQLIWQVIQTLNPSVGTLRVVGQQPTITPAWLRNPGAGSLRIEGQAPTINLEQSWTVEPGVGTFRLVGQPVTIITPYQSYPGTATFRLAGQAATVDQTWSASPGVGSLRLAGNASPLVDIGHKVANPLPGTIRLVGQGRIEKAQALTWIVFDTYVTRTWSILWQRSAFLYYYQSLNWDVHSKVCATRHRLRQRRMTTAPRTRSMTLRATQRRIQVRSCANQ